MGLKTVNYLLVISYDVFAYCNGNKLFNSYKYFVM